MVRLEPYGRVTFLLDYWSAMPSLLASSPKGVIRLRGYVGVAGRTRRPQLSRRRLQWTIRRGDYTAIAGSPTFTPFAVLWRAIYPQLPQTAEDEPDRHPLAGKPVTRGMLRFLLDKAMSGFDERPDRALLQARLEEAARGTGDKFPMVGFATLEGYEALDRMQGHLSEWTDGLTYRLFGEVQSENPTLGTTADGDDDPSQDTATNAPSD